MINLQHAFEFAWTALILIALQARSLNAFFEYTDCDVDCVERNVSCVIVEINPSYFPCECLVNGDQCVALASESQVCLRPNAKALGGERIWNDFERHRNISVSTTTPFSTSSTTTNKPRMAESCNEYLIPLIALALTNAASIISNIYLFIKIRNRTNSDYSRIPPSNEVYQATVQNGHDEQPGDLGQ